MCGRFAITATRHEKRLVPLIREQKCLFVNVGRDNFHGGTPGIPGLIHSGGHAQALYLVRVLLIHVAEKARYPDRHE
jgi:hypothetical protein